MRMTDQINAQLASFLDSMEKDLPEQLAQLEKQAIQDEVPIIRRQSQSLLRFLIRTHQPQKVLEVGTAVGFSSLFMLEYGSRTMQITTIEKVPQRILEAKKNFKNFCSQERIHLCEGDAQNILEELEKEHKEYDMVFMDAAKGQYMRYLTPILSMMKPGAILVTDNVLLEGTILRSKYAVTRRDRTIHERMREYLYCLTHTKGLETVIIPMGDGMAVTYVLEDFGGKHGTTD